MITFLNQILWILFTILCGICGIFGTNKRWFNQQNHRYETSFHRPRRSLLRLAVSRRSLLRLAVSRHSRVKREYEEGWVGSASVYRKQARAKQGTLIFDEYFFTVKSVLNCSRKNIHSSWPCWVCVSCCVCLCARVTMFTMRVLLWYIP